MILKKQEQKQQNKREKKLQVMLKLKSHHLPNKQCKIMLIDMETILIQLAYRK
jgi:hypothetical protein